jgi:hypothetical protein
METAMAGAKGLVRWIQVHVVRFCGLPSRALV